MPQVSAARVERLQKHNVIVCVHKAVFAIHLCREAAKVCAAATNGHSAR